METKQLTQCLTCRYYRSSKDYNYHPDLVLGQGTAVSCSIVGRITIYSVYKATCAEFSAAFGGSTNETE